MSTDKTEYMRRWRKANREKTNKSARIAYARDGRQESHRISSLNYYHRNKDAVNNKCKETARNNRLAALNHYSNGTMSCACCPPTQKSYVEFLCIDHLDKRPRGASKPGGTGADLHRFLKRNNYPEGFRVLCHNCNMSLGFYGYCPHQVS